MKVGNNMKTTGVVRRIDDLGRIVIPKEIRRNLKIRDGDELEFFLENETICLKKFSKMSDLSVVINKMLEVSNSLINKTILVSDREFVFSACGNLKKSFLNKETSNTLFNMLSSRECVVQKVASKFEIIKGLSIELSYVLYPIICYGDIIGAVIILSEVNDISDFDVNIGKMIAQFLGKYVEE